MSASSRRLGPEYYERNPLTEIAELRRRVAALERKLTQGRGWAGSEREAAAITDATPDAMLPTAADIPRLLLVDAETRFVWQLVVREAEDEADDRELLFLRRVGRLRADVTLPEEGA